MFRRNSIFVKILIPVVAVVLIQIGIISSILFINGTVDALDDSAIATLSQNMENRAVNLESMMVSYWSNLGKLEFDMTAQIGGYLAENGLEINDVRGNYLRETSLLSSVSQSLISALRTTVSTGIFVYFLDSAGYSEDAQICNGLYYRDLDPFANQGDNSDLMFERGHVDTARKDRIQLGSLWSETFAFTPENADTWRGFANPQIAAARFPDAVPADLSYWNRPHLLNPDSPLDASRCITYTRPFFYEGELIAIIGTEVQAAQLERSFPASDFDSFGQSGYMLLGYGARSDQRSEPPETLSAEVFQVSGGYIRQLIGRQSEMSLTAVPGGGSYDIAGGNTDGIRAAVRPLRLYNANAPFEDEQWALAAVSTENMLFESSRNVTRGIVFGSLTAIFLGGAVLVLTIRRSTDPLISIVGQLEESGNDAVVSDSNTYEIARLASTINTMRERRNLAEERVREERERYLVALESTADTFMEYDVLDDSFKLYYFSESEDAKARLSERVIPRFTDAVSGGGFCHPDDIGKVVRFMRSAWTDPIEIRAGVSVFSHIKGVVPDGEYYWFFLKASAVYDGGGNAVKIIGTAKEITREKLEEYAAVEAGRRDVTTGLFNAAYGAALIRVRLDDAARQGIPSVVGVIHVEDFDKLETFYGRVFGGVVMSGIGHMLAEVMPCGAVAARLSNDDFLMFVSSVPREDIVRLAENISANVSGLCTGENSEIKMNMRVGAVCAADGEALNTLISRADCAARYAASEDCAAVFFDDIPREERAGTAPVRDKPVSVFLNTGRENIISLTFELFERTSAVHSAAKALLCLLGRLFNLARISVCAYDAAFGANQVLYEWENGRVRMGAGIEKIEYRDFADFEALLDEYGTLSFAGSDFNTYGEGVQKLLCMTPGADIDGFCCVMFENETHTGRIVFFGKDRDWPEEERRVLYEVVKIVAAHMSIEKSHSASRAKSEFLSRVSHEIRTPMNAILGMTDIALKSGEDAERVNDALRKIDFSAKHLLALINDVLDMSRIESGRLQIERAAFSMDGFIKGLETLMRMPIESGGVDFIINSRFSHTEVMGDEYRLRQVLVNLLGNAGKFTNPGGTVIFRVEESESEEDAAYFRFSVKDTGIGISMEEQVRVFKAFEQAGNGAERQNGTGLGLAISTSIVSAMGGKIELISKPGEGSEFYFTVKLELSENVSGGEKTGESAFDYRGCFAGKRALLVEDVDINVEIASFVLAETGIAVEVAVNGKEAIDLFFASPAGYYDVILMDIQMPVMDGLTAARHIRRDTTRADSRTVPIVAMTANAFDEDMKKSVESGMNGHMAKPLEREKMFALLRQLLLNRELQEDLE